MPSWKKVLISGSDAALNSLNVTAALTASGLYYPTSDGNSGEVLITDGLGNLSFTNISSGYGATIKLNQSVAATTWSFAHNTGEKYPVVNVYDTNDEIIVPGEIQAVDSNNLTIYFDSPTAGTAIAVVGGVAVTASYVHFDNIDSKPSLISGSQQIASDISGSFTSVSSSIASDIEDIIDGTTLVASASYALTASYATNFVANSITSSIISASYIDLDVLSNGDIPAHKPGRIFFGAEDGTLSVYNEEADITLQVGQEFFVRVYNGTANPIANGTPVRVSGSQGDRMKIYPALAEDHTTGPVFDNHIIGVTTHEIEASSEGYVTAQGIVRGVDTSGFLAGDILYLETGSAGLRNTPPPFPYDIVQVGYVARSASPNGFIFVEPKEPVHFANISGLSGSYTPEVGDLWVHQANSSWTHTKTLSGSYVIDNGGLTANSFTGSLLGTASYAGNANLLDGVNSTQFLRNDQSGTLTGNLTITGSLDVTGDINARSFTGSIAIGEDDTLSIGSQIFYPQGNNGFSVNEDFDPSNSSLQTAYHFTSGTGRETVAFTLARTGQFTDGFGIYGTAADNTFVMFGEQSNTSFEWRRNVGIQPLDLDGGTLMARLNTAGQFWANSISSSNGITGSLLGTASYADNANSSSYAFTSSYASTFNINGTDITSQQNIDVDTGTETVATVSTTLYDGAFFDYVAKDGTNFRAGTVMSVWDGSSIQFTDTSTQDIGDTTGVVLSVDISGTDARLRATVSSDNWTIKAFVRAI